jgi:hypothetical protein
MRLHYRSPARKGYGLHLRCQPPSVIARSIVARSLWMGRGQPRPLLATRHLEHPAGRAGPGGRPARPAHPARPVRLPPRHIHRRGLRQPLQRDRRQPLNPQRPIHRCRWRPHNKQAKEHGNRESRPRPPRRHTRLGGHRRLRARQPLQRALPRQHIVRQSEAQPLVKKGGRPQRSHSAFSPSFFLSWQWRLFPLREISWLLGLPSPRLSWRVALCGHPR